jgi:hypothetical protein
MLDVWDAFRSLLHVAQKHLGVLMNPLSMILCFICISFSSLSGHPYLSRVRYVLVVHIPKDKLVPPIL